MVKYVTRSFPLSGDIGGKARRSPNPLGFHGNPSNSCQDISRENKDVKHIVALEEKSPKGFDFICWGP